MPRGRAKLSNETKAKNRKESYHKYNAKRRIAGLNQHPNAFANLATSALREQYIKELEDGMVRPKFSESMDDGIDYDPDEDFRGSQLNDDEGRFADREFGDAIHPNSGFNGFNPGDTDHHDDTANAIIPEEPSGEKPMTPSGTPRVSSNVY